MSRATRVLFLHGGPGLDAEAERRWFADRLPIDWWDQPPKHADSVSWTEEVIGAASHRVSELADASGGPVSIVAHSYGCLLASRIVTRLPQRIDSMTLISPGVSLIDQYSKVGEHLAASTTAVDVHELRAALANLRSHRDAGALMQVAAAITALPGWQGAYFSPSSRWAYDQYMRLLPNGPRLDVATFMAGVADHVASATQAEPSVFAGRVRVLIGFDDVLLDAAAIGEHWRGLYRQAEIEVLPVGHMLHFEAAPERWFPGPR